MKKIFILLIMLFFLTSCNVKYNLTYENGSFKENLNVTQEKQKGDNTVDDLKSFYEANKNNSDYNLFYNLSGNIEELIFKKESTNTINYARYIIFILVMAVGVGFVIYKYRKDKRI